ncbi:hypothetical protein L873DRAFT_1806932 [Choiromyces venosus 120613-1]|uniref:Ribosomal protein L10 n=1 Tax=Choiromyces venosus 120613-1 TaxID=1336337 RepID=A0A3N4JTB8_9PEZI|nr:hypothetical protein L873DRAFT_1806932 [Choiromyces venosus 120613-1]
MALRPFQFLRFTRTYATLTSSTTSVSPDAPLPPPTLPGLSPTQPRTVKSPLTRKTQLHRTYLSLLRSTPLMLFFQHNNLRATEWVALRRELLFGLRKIDPNSTLAEGTRITVLKPALFASSLRVAEGHDPLHKRSSEPGGSKIIAEKTEKLKETHPLSPVLTGPVAALSFPSVEPVHLKAALDILFPLKNPKKGLDPLAISGLQKFVLLAGRVDGHVYGSRSGEGRVMDIDLIRVLALLPDVNTLRGELLAMLRGAGGADLVMNLGNVGIGLTRTVHTYQKMLSGELDSDGNPVQTNAEGGEEKKE